MTFVLREDEIGAIRDEAWRIHGTRVRLKSSLWDRPLRGAGSIELAADGFLLRFYPAPRQQFDIHEQLYRSMDPQTPPADKVVRGVFQDVWGRNWHLQPFRTWFDAGDGGFVLLGRPPSLRCRKQPPIPVEAFGGTLWFLPTLKFPANTITEFEERVARRTSRRGSNNNAAEVDIGDVKFQFVSKSPGECTVVSLSPKELPPNWQLRICEALLLITGRWHDWSASSEFRGALEEVEVRAPRSPEPSRVPPFLKSASPAIDAQSWGLFQSYLDLTWSDGRPRLHGLAVALRSAARASNAHIEALAVALAVSIESVLKSEFGELRSRASLSTEQVAPALALVSESKLDDPLKRRILGAIGAMRHPRAQEMLSILMREGKVRQELVQRFGNLRHPALHGEPVSEEALGQRAELVWAGVTLLYELILARVAYQGPYTDHYLGGDAPRSYPPGTPSNEECP